MSDCCEHKPVVKNVKKKNFDFIFWGALTPVVISYFAFLFFPEQIAAVADLEIFSQSVFELMNKMFWGLMIGILFVGILVKVPRELVVSALGKGGTFTGILRATGAGVLLDLCSHGILLVGMKLYERGASLGQVMAFLIASPWNSISLTLVLWALVGFWWMLAFLVLSVLIAIISGTIFDKLVARGTLPANPNKTDIPVGYKFWPSLLKAFKGGSYYPSSILDTLWQGLKGSRMILKWIFFGVILASAIRTFVPPESFETLFGPTIAGLGLTLVVATIMEVCSEGSTPIAADILTRAGAPGNSFAFLMTGVSTDYTEIIAIRETTKSWKIAFFLPLVTLPQVIAIALAINFMG